MKKMIILIFTLIISFVLGGCVDSSTPPEETIYTVNFYDDEGNIIDTQQIKENGDATPPSPLEKAGYIFKGWDQEYMNVSSNLDIHPVFEKKVTPEYVVKFHANGNVISSQNIKENEAAIAPVAPFVESHIFKGWNEDFTNITSNLNVYAIYERIRYVSHVVDFDIKETKPISSLINNISRDRATAELNNIFEGGLRRTDQLNYYIRSHNINRNVYGFEVAVNQSGIVIDVNTLVEIPENGFILSGHGKSSTLLQQKIKIGDLVIYDNNTKTAKVYRDLTNSPIIYLGIKIEHAKEKIIQAIDNYKALDYVLLNQKINQLIEHYNEIIDEYSYDIYRLCDQLLLDIDFLLIETKPVQTNAIWHYPLRSGSFAEQSTKDVQRLLDEYAEMGINRIYLNTNFNGRSIYKSQYLTQSLSNYYTYDGYKDYLECFIEEAHKRNIFVYAWTNTLIAGDGMNNKFYSDRGWILKGYNGEDNFGGMYFVDISNNEVQEFLKNVFYELATEYNLDGIEFDFIRYPSGNLHSFSGQISESQYINDSGYTETFISSFKEYYPFEGDFKELIRTDENLRSAWLSFKTNVLTLFVEDLTTTIRNANSDIKITAAVMPSITSAINAYRQDWKTWIENGYIDILEPMIYTGDTDNLIRQLQSMYEIVDGNAEIVVGIFPEGSGAMPGVNAEQVDRIIELFPVGWSKFSSKTIFNHSFYKESFKYIMRTYTVQSDAEDSDIFKSYIIDLKEKVDNFYNYIVNTNSLSQILDSQDIMNTTEYNQVLKNIETAINNIDNTIIRTRLMNTNLYIQSLIIK